MELALNPTLKDPIDENKRSFLKQAALTALVSTSTIVMAAEMEACNILSDLETWLPVGLSAFDTLISYINPAAGTALATILGTVNGLWQAVATAISNYKHTTDPTTTLLDKIIAALDALQGGLNQILSALPASLSTAVLNAVRFGFSLLLSTLKSIQGSLGSPTVPSTAESVHKAQTAKLEPQTINGVASAKNAADFISQFNLKVCVAAGHSARLK